MIRLIFLLVINISLYGAVDSCKEHYNPNNFEESSDELNSIVEEYFIDRNISFLPTLKDVTNLGLLSSSDGSYQLPHSTQSYKEITLPTTAGIWRYTLYDYNITTTHLLIKEPTRLSEIEAINTYNDLLGAYWYDYSVTAYEMTLEPQDSRIRYNDRYFELNVKVYGLLNDATKLPKSVADIQFRDYTAEVERYIKCKGQR